jgi:hypothetical protein
VLPPYLDKNIGEKLLKCFDKTLKQPWLDEEFYTRVPSPNPKKRKCAARKRFNVKEFGGRFSMIIPLETSGLYLGIYHGSHRVGGTRHVGGSTRVFVPIGSFIIFHSTLYHYGDKCIVDGGKVNTSVRAFAYMVKKDFVKSSQVKTFPLGDDKVCDGCDGCSTCKKLSELLQTVSHKDGSSWAPDFSYPVDGEEVIMGDLDTLGWAVIKSGYEVYSKDLQVELALSIKHSASNLRHIQKKNEIDMQFPSLIRDEDYFHDLHKNGVKMGSRCMITERGIVEDQKLHNQLHELMRMFDHHVGVASKLIHNTTGIVAEYKYEAPNLLLNSGIVPEQFVHRDFPDNRFDKKTVF